jgi:TonB family protein
VLAEAVQRYERGDLVSPPNDNARYYYELVLSSDPQNATAIQGLASIASKLVLQARAEIDANRFDAAADLLSDARRVDPGSSELAAATRALNDAEDRVANEARRQEQQRQAAARAEADRVAAEERAAEQRAANERQAELNRQAELDRQAELERQAEADRQAAARRAAEDAAVLLAAQQVATSATGSNAAAGPEKLAANDPGQGTNSLPPEAATMGPEIPSANTQPEAPVAVSTLTRTRYVAPKYPRVAERRNLSGWVDIVFTVDVDGTTKNVEVRGSEPGQTFVSAATKAVEKWEFMPIFENGVVVEKRAGVRMMFAIE